MRFRRWAWLHLGVLTVGFGGIAVVPDVLGPWWIVGLVLGAVFTLVMTRRCVAEDARLPEVLRRRWDRRLLWLGPVAVLQLALFGVGRAEE